MRNLVEELKDMKRVWFEDECWGDDWGEHCQQSIDLAVATISQIPSDILDARGKPRWIDGNKHDPSIDWKISGNIYLFWEYQNMAFQQDRFSWDISLCGNTFHYETHGMIPDLGVHQWLEVRRLRKQAGLFVLETKV